MDAAIMIREGVAIVMCLIPLLFLKRAAGAGTKSKKALHFFLAILFLLAAVYGVWKYKLPLLMEDQLFANLESQPFKVYGAGLCVAALAMSWTGLAAASKTLKG